MQSERGVADRAEHVRPLLPGTTAPSFTLPAADGHPYHFDSGHLTKPAVIAFYRGGWCPYCNRQLTELRHAENDLIQLGYEVLFVSADRHEMLRPSLKDSTLQYRLLSDNDMEVAEAYGLAFRVDDETIARYLEMGIDLEAASGRKHHVLPVPAVFVIDRGGVIRFQYANPNYRERISPELLVTAARLAVAGPDGG